MARGDPPPLRRRRLPLLRRTVRGPAERARGAVPAWRHRCGRAASNAGACR